MSCPDPQDLVQVLSLQKKEDFRIAEQKSFVEKHSNPGTNEKFQKILSYFQPHENLALRIGIQSAFLGALYAFLDRELDPFHPNHFSLFFTLEKDVTEAFQLVSKGNFDKELWVFETFDYGIKHVYYLDWQLYLSKVCY